MAGCGALTGVVPTPTAAPTGTAAFLCCMDVHQDLSTVLAVPQVVAHCLPLSALVDSVERRRDRIHRLRKQCFLLDARMGFARGAGEAAALTHSRRDRNEPSVHLSPSVDQLEATRLRILVGLTVEPFQAGDHRRRPGCGKSSPPRFP